MRNFSGGWPRGASPFHKGEVEFQRKVGVADQLEQFARRVIRPYMPDQHREFFANLPLVYLGYADKDGWPVATVSHGGRGFVSSPDPKTLIIKQQSHVADGLLDQLSVGTSVGVLGLEMHSRRRNRLSGFIEEMTADELSLRVVQSFGNCPQYIQSKELLAPSSIDFKKSSQIEELSRLDKGAVSLIERAQTFFVASLSDGQQAKGTDGVDVSHRGGRSGFVKVDGNSITIPDFTGNFYFNTLGNFLINPKAGLLFVDYETGDLLQISGVVDFLEDDPDLAYFEGAERAWRVTFKKGRWLRGVIPYGWTKGEMSVNSILTGTWEEAKARRLLAAKGNGWRPFQVQNIEEEAKGIKSFYLQPSDKGAMLPFKAGQFLTFSLPISVEGPVIRTYTISSSPLDQSYRISVKRDGVASSYLHDLVSTGSILDVKAPKGAFFRDARQMRPTVLLAAGIGVTPMLSMIRDALQMGVKYRQMAPLVFLYVTRHMEDRAFHFELKELERLSAGAFEYISLLTQPGVGAVCGVDFDHEGYITTDLICEHCPAGDVDYFVCGPDGFMQSTYNLLRQKGVSDDRIFTEAFGPSSLRRDQDNYVATPLEMADQVSVHFARQDLTFLWRPEDGTLLEFAESHGFEPEFSCRSGNCGSCAVRLNKGSVVYSNSITTPVGDGEILLCSAHPAKGSEDVILDL